MENSPPADGATPIAPSSEANPKPTSTRLVTIREWRFTATNECIGQAELRENLKLALNAIRRLESGTKPPDSSRVKRRLKLEEKALAALGIQYESSVEVRRQISEPLLGTSKEPITQKADASTIFIESPATLSSAQPSENQAQPDSPLEISFRSARIISNPPSVAPSKASTPIKESHPHTGRSRANFPQQKNRSLKELSISLIKDILCHRLNNKISRDETAKKFQVAQGTVTTLVKRAKSAGWNWEQIDKVTGAELLAVMRPDLAKQRHRVEPNFAAVYDWIRSGQTRLNVWHAYRHRYVQQATYSYPQFCKLYAAWLRESLR